MSVDKLPKPKVILVANKNKLIEIAAELEMRKNISKYQLLPYLSLMTLYLKTKSLGEQNIVNLYFYKRKYKGWSEERLIFHINELVDFGLPIYNYTPDEAMKKFNFGLSLPKSGHFYISNPLFNDLCVPIDTYVKVICEEKTSAFLRIAATLGAKSIELRDVNYSAKKGFFNSNIDGKSIALFVGIKASFDSSDMLERKVIKKFDRPVNFSAPYVPKEFSKWVDYDPDLRIMVSDRMEANVVSSQVSLRYSSDIAGGGQFAMNMANKGIILRGI